MMPTTDNSKMPDSEIFKERFTTDNLKMPDSETVKKHILATAKNKEEILETLQLIKKENILKILKRKEN